MSDQGPNDDRLADLFGEALELEGDGRDRFLASIAEREVRAEVERLLALHDRSGGFLGSLAEEVEHISVQGLLPGPEAPALAAEFEILELIGEGGMGQVYKARDATLDRVVALKFLPGSAAAAARVLAEARAASALDHPNIATVFQVGTSQAGSGGLARPFIAMPFYDGETIAEKIRGGRISIPRVLDWMTQVARGLSAAHGHGLVHRDIKPGNVMITRANVAKILDFGIATLAGSGAGLPAGTLPYMSPEQLQGGAVGPGSDVWSFGVVLYETLTGARPFSGDTREDVLEAILSGPLPNVREVRADVPAGLLRLMSASLTVDPAARLRNGGELLDELRVVARSVTTEPQLRPGVVVVPFANISADEGNEYFSDGVTEEVVTHLSSVRSIRVIGRSSTMRLKGLAREPVEAGRLTGVEYAVEGGVRRAGDRLRVTAHLVDVSTGERLWSGRFDGTADEVFEIQEAVARGVVQGLSITLTEAESRELARRPIPDLKAYELLLRARHEAWRFSAPSLEQARRLLTDALDRLGDNEVIYSTLGHVIAMSIESGLEASSGALDRVEALSEQVFSLNPASARGHWLKGFASLQRGDLPAAIRAGRRALELDPDDPDTLILLGYVYLHSGHMEEAGRLLDRAVELDPLTPLTQCMPGAASFMGGAYREAVGPYRRMYELDPNSPFSQVMLGWALAYAGDNDEAQEVFERAAATFPGTPFASWAQAFARGLAGDPDGAAAAVTPAFRGAAQGSEMFSRALTHCYALAGQTDEALRWLRHAVELGMWNLPFLEVHDRFLEPLRREAGFADLLERVRELRKGLAGLESAPNSS